MTSNKPKILMLLENNAYPQDSRVRKEAETLIKADFQVSIIAPRGKNQVWSEIVGGVHVYRYPAPIEADGFLGYLLEFGYSLIIMFILSLFVLFRQGFDIVHAHNPPDVLVLIAIFYKLIGKKFVFDHHDLSPELYNAKANGEGNQTIINALLFFEKLTFRFANHVISTNQSYKDIAISRGLVSEDMITIVRNGPLLDTLVNVTPDPNLLKKEAKLIGYIGEMGFQDGVDYLIRSIHFLVNDLNRKDIYLILIGSGSAVDSLNALVDELHLGDYVYFAGYQPFSVWRSLLASVHMGAVPDPINDFNNKSTMIKITDYMGLCKPVVAFDLTEHRVTAGDAALYAEPNNEMDFARKIELLMDNDEMREEMGNLGYERITKELAWNYQAEKLLIAYGKLINE